MVKSLSTLPLLTLLTLPLFFCSCPSLAIDKCLYNGKITYTDLPCPPGSETLPFSGHVTPADDPAAAHKRYLADQKKLNQLLKANEQQDKQDQHDARVAAQLARQEQMKEIRCTKLDARRRAALQNKLKNKRGTPKQIEHAERLAEKAEDIYAEQCLTSGP
jgi:hypothetical protein